MSLSQNKYLNAIRLGVKEALNVSIQNVLPHYDTSSPKGEYQTVNLVSWNDYGIPYQDNQFKEAEDIVQERVQSYYRLSATIDFLRGNAFERSNKMHAWCQTDQASEHFGKYQMSFVSYGFTRDLSFVETSKYTPRIQAELMFGVSVIIDGEQLQPAELFPFNDALFGKFIIDLSDDNT